MNWPNLITLCRLFSVPVMIWLVLTHEMVAAFFVFIGAGVSDFLDGLLARLLKKHTQIGAYLDPLADKCLLVALTIVLTIQGFLPLWLGIVIVFRDVLIVAGALLNFILNLDIAIQPLGISKLNTFVQMFTIAFILSNAAFSVPNLWILNLMFIFAGLTTILSGAAYVQLWVKRVNQSGS